jgi:hypothetical protein
MKPEINQEVVGLIEQLRQMQEEAEALAARQVDLRKQLKFAEEKALELHHKLVEDTRDLGGEG